MADIQMNKSDIDEVNDAMHETDEEAYALDFEFTEEKEYKTVQKIDDFYTGNASDLKKKVMISELKNLTNDIVGKNGWEMIRQIYERTKITSTEREMKDFYNKYVKSLRLKINEDGVFEIVVNEY